MSANNNQPTLPSLEGFTFRTFQGDQSFYDMLAVIASIETLDWYPYKGNSFEEIKHDYENRTHFDINRDLVIAFKGEEPIAYGRLSYEFEEPEKNLVFYCGMSVNPDPVYSSFQQCFLDWFNVRALEIAQTLAPAPAALISVFAFEKQESFLETLKSNGYQVARYFYDMKRNLLKIPTQPLPAGLVVKPVQPEHYRRIYDANMEAFRDHWGFVEPEEGDYERWLKEPIYFTPGTWQVAWDGEEVAGMVLNFIDKSNNKATGIQAGYTEDIAVRRPWRRKGLAKALICRSMQMFKEMGMSEVRLGVDANNPNGATKLYHDLGYAVTFTTFTYRKPLEPEGG